MFLGGRWPSKKNRCLSKAHKQALQHDAHRKYAKNVTTIELDPAALEIARQNPWSQDLFDNPQINQRLGDSYEIIQEFEDGFFRRVIQDPPAFKLAGLLYTFEFYAELNRVLQAGGRLFHYIGNPKSKSGRIFTHGVIQRLRQAGFKHVQRRPSAFCVLAYQ